MKVTVAYCDICKKEIGKTSCPTTIKLPVDDMYLADRLIADCSGKKPKHYITTIEEEICDECANKIIDTLAGIVALRRKII